MCQDGRVRANKACMKNVNVMGPYANGLKCGVVEWLKRNKFR